NLLARSCLRHLVLLRVLVPGSRTKVQSPASMLHMPQRTLSGPGSHLAWPSQKMAMKPPEWRVPTFTSAGLSIHWLGGKSAQCVLRMFQTANLYLWFLLSVVVVVLFSSC